MKYLIQICCIVLFLSGVYPLHATLHLTGELTKKEAVKGFKEGSGKKLPFVHRIALKLVQKKIKKSQKKREKRRSKSKGDKLATLALLFGVSVYLLALIPFVAPLSFFVSIAAVVAGILALKSRGNKFRAILGIVLGGLFFLLIIVSLAIFLSDPPGG